MKRPRCWHFWRHRVWRMCRPCFKREWNRKLRERMREVKRENEHGDLLRIAAKHDDTLAARALAYVREDRDGKH